ncbi:precorrin-8X methylmutase [Paradevosia shaoguanensis]|uniref:precorrin-8X methylmutase n=1 Tax=Paradevosia shaoguanensis TaxID=1335043 RepID=UPI003C794BD0
MINAAELAAQRREMFVHAAQLAHLPKSLDAAIVAMIEVCGMVDLVVDIRADAGLVAAIDSALLAGRPVLCDCEMVREGIDPAVVGESPVISKLNDPAVPDIARTIGNTRSAAAVDLWGEALDGAIVVVGNAPTALFRLYELLEGGAPRPAAIIGIPVGFVGAAESKAHLAEGVTDVPYLTVLGRRGGSAMASAAFNAIAGGIVR